MGRAARLLGRRACWSRTCRHIQPASRSPPEGFGFRPSAPDSDRKRPLRRLHPPLCRRFSPVSTISGIRGPSSGKQRQRRPRYGGPWDIGARPSCQPGRQSPVLGGAPILPRRPPCPVGRPAELALAPLAVPGDAAVLGDLAVGAGLPSGLRSRPAPAGLSTLEAG